MAKAPKGPDIDALIEDLETATEEAGARDRDPKQRRRRRTEGEKATMMILREINRRLKADGASGLTWEMITKITTALNPYHRLEADAVRDKRRVDDSETDEIVVRWEEVDVSGRVVASGQGPSREHGKWGEQTPELPTGSTLALPAPDDGDSEAHYGPPVASSDADMTTESREALDAADANERTLTASALLHAIEMGEGDEAEALRSLLSDAVDMKVEALKVQARQRIREREDLARVRNELRMYHDPDCWI